MNYQGKALTIAGSDSGGGAGIQADLKTFQAFNVYGMSVITSITAQNTVGVSDIFDLPSSIIASQMDAVFSDIEPDAIKVGMLSNRDIIATVSEKLKQYQVKKLVVDSVMVSKSGARLLRADAEKYFMEMLVPIAYLITPNLEEAQIISGMTIHNLEDAKKAAILIFNLGARNILIKGGHMEDEEAIDLLFDGTTFSTFTSLRFVSKNTHGTGCTLSSAITAELSKGKSLELAIQSAKKYITEAIKNAPNNIGKGFGPLYHNIAGFYD
jgi:hydroxymethylpyrimidine/phosphomethylpyrimidine kinase